MIRAPEQAANICWDGVILNFGSSTDIWNTPSDLKSSSFIVGEVGKTFVRYVTCNIQTLD